MLVLPRMLSVSTKLLARSDHHDNGLWRRGDEAQGAGSDYFRWRNLWPKIAAVFEMAVADPQTICLCREPR